MGTFISILRVIRVPEYTAQMKLPDPLKLSSQHNCSLRCFLKNFCIQFPIQTSNKMVDKAESVNINNSIYNIKNIYDFGSV